MAQDKENPLARWSRLKREAASAPAAPKPVPKAAPAPPPRAPAAPPELPPLDQLTPDSDFSAFMDPRVDERLRRLALNKLFSDPRLNIVDGLDDFAEDYSLLEDLPQELVAKLEHARSTLRRRDPEEEKEKEAEPVQDVAQAVEAQPEHEQEGNEDEGEDPQDVARRQDT
jgi:hypothetical protein